ncbi:unnamed protein product, partial [Ilex paraguariensis]
MDPAEVKTIPVKATKTSVMPKEVIETSIGVTLSHLDPYTALNLKETSSRVPHGTSASPSAGEAR